MARSSNVIGKVAALQGEAFVRLEDGTLIRLKLGDEVHEGDVIVTGEGAKVELAFNNGHEYAIPEKEFVAIDASVFADTETHNAALLPRVAEDVDIQNTIAQGGSLDQLLEETEAGLDGGGSDGSHSFVELDRIVEAVTPLNFEFSTADRGTLPEFQPLSGVGNADASGTSGGNAFVPPPVVVGVANVTNDTQTEGTDLVHTVTLSGASSTTTTFAFSLNGNTAGAGDFGTPTFSNGVTLVNGNLVVPPGVDRFTVTVPTTVDGTHEHNETLTLTVGGQTVVDTIVDADPVTVSLSATPGITEAGGTIVYTATFTQAPLADATITLSNGAVITVTAGQLTGSVNVPFAPSDNAYVDGSSVSVAITNVASTDTEIRTDVTPAVTTVTDTIDATTLNLTATPTVNEGGSITYTATVDHAPQGDLVIALSNGQDITILSGQLSGSVNVTAPADSVYVDGSTVTATIVGTPSGGNFESLVVGTGSASTTVTDTTNTTAITLSAATDVNEGGSIVYTATVGAPVTGNPLVITLTDAAHTQIIIPVGQTSADSAPVAVRGDDAYAQGTQAVTVGIQGTPTGGNFEALDTGSTVSTNVHDNGNATTVMLSASPSVAEGGSIVYTATLGSNAQTAVTVVLNTGETITIGVGQASASISIPVHTDSVYVDAGSVVRNIDTATGGGFEALAPNTAPVSTNVTDTLDNTTLSLTGSASVAEGATATYTVSLTHPADTDVTIPITYSGTVDGQDFTGVTNVVILAGQSQATFNVAALDDNLVEGTETLTVTLGTPTGGNFENLTIGAGSVTTSVLDNDVSTVSLTATPSITEAGGAVVYTATLTQAPLTDVVVTLSNGATVTIVAGQLAGSTNVSIPASDDVYLDATSISATITGHTGGGIAIDIDPTAAVTQITDTVDTTTVNLSATPSVTEGGTITYTATIDHAPQGNVVVALSNGQNITILSGQLSGSISVAAPADDAAIDASVIPVTVNSASGGNFEQLVVGTGSVGNPVVTTVTDTIDVTTLNLTATPTVAEGGSIVYTVGITNPADTDLTVTLDNGRTVTILAGQSSGSVTVPAPSEDVFTDAGVVTVAITGHTGGNLESLVIGTGSASTAVTDTIDNTTLNLSATPTVAEGGSIVYTATLTHATDTAMSVTLSNGAIINIAAGQSTGTATVAAPADDAVIDAGNVPVTVTTTNGGNFEQLTIGTGATGNPVITAVTDTTTPTTLSLTATPTVDEGGNITYTASVSNPAGTDMTVTLNNGSLITILAGQSSGTVTVPAPTDDVYIDAGNVSATITGHTGGNFESVVNGSISASTAVADTINATTLDLSATPTVAEGGSIVYTATLGSAAQSAVTVSLTDSAGVVHTLTIAAGNTVGSISVPAPADDVYVDSGTVSAHITNASGGGFENLVPNSAPAVTTVSDTLDITTLTLSGAANVTEGGTVAYTVSLTHPAETDVTIPVTYSGTVNGSDYTGVVNVVIAAGQSQATFNVATTDDTLAEGAENLVVTIGTPTGGNFENLVIDQGSVTTAIADNDVSTVSLTATPSLTEAGGTLVYTATLTQAPLTPVTVSVTDSFGDVHLITVAAGQTTGSVNVPIAASDDVYLDASTISGTITGATGGGITLATDSTPAVTQITDTIDVTHITLSATPAVTEGGSIVYTATVGAAVTGSPLIITLNDAAHTQITIGVGQTTANSVPVMVRGDDAYAQGAQAITVGIDTVSGGNYEAIDKSATASTTVNDDADVTTLTLTATPTVDEGGNITYTASVTNPVDTPLTVVLSNGQSIVIAAGASSGTLAVAAPTDDVYIDHGNVTATIVGTPTGGNFENLVIGTGSATTAVADTINATTLNLTATPTVNEGGSITYTATVDHAPQGDLVIALSNGQNITILSGQLSGSVNVAAPADDALVDAGTVSATIVGTPTGGNYEQLTIGTGAVGNPVTTNVTDTVDTTTLNLTATTNVAEGGNIVYTATVDHATGSNLTVALSNGNTITILAGQQSGSVTVAAPIDDVYVDGGTVTATIVGTPSGGNFENLVVGKGSANTAVSDTIDVTTVSLTGPASLTEGNSGTYQISLGAIAQTAVTVQITYGGTANGSDFTGVTSVTIPAGQSGATFDVSALHDGSVEGLETLTVNLGSVSGGNFEQLSVNPAAASVSTNIVDSDTTTVSLTATPGITEAGGPVVYTATLTQATVSDLTVTLSNGASITIAAGQLTGNTSVPIAASEDVYLDAHNISATISGTTGGGVNIAIDPSAAVTAIADTIDATTLNLSATPTVAEGGNIVYTATLDHAAGTAMTVTLSNGAIINIAAGQSTGTATVAAPGDDALIDAGTVPVTVTNTSGGNFEQLNIGHGAAGDPVTTTVTDTIDATTLSLTATPTVAEGGNITYTASVSHPTGSDLTVTLSNGSLITILAGQSTGAVTIAAPSEDVYKDAGNVSVTVTGTSGGNFEQLVNGTVTATTAVTDTIDNTTLNLSATPTVAEGGSIVYTATLTHAADTAMSVTLSNGAIINIAAGQSTGTATVAAPADDAVIDAGNVPVTVTTTNGGNFEQLTIGTGATGNPVITAVTDTTTPTTLSLTATPTVDEGGNITYTASVSNPAGTDMTVTLNNGSLITILAGQSSGTVTVPAPTDDVYIDAGNVSATITGHTGGNFESVVNGSISASTAVADTINATTLDLSATPTVAEGGSIVYTATLTHAAETAMTVTLSNGAVINIAAGQVAGSVTVAAPGDDAVIDAGSVNTTVTNTSGGNFEQLNVGTGAVGHPVTTTVTDTINTTTLSLTAASTVDEGGNITYTASVTNPAGTDMTVTLNNGSLITILAGQSSGTVTVAAPTDDVFIDAGNVTATITGHTGGNFENVVNGNISATTAVADTIDATTLNLSATPTVAEGGNIVYTATLTHATDTAMSVTLSNGAVINIAAGQITGNVTVAAPADDAFIDAGTVPVTVSNTVGGNLEQLNVGTGAVGNPVVTTVTDTIDTTTLSLSATPTVAEGGNIVYTATLTHAADTPLTVVLSNGQSIVIAAGASSGTLTVAAPTDDAYIDAAPVTTTIVSHSGGNLENVVIGTASASTAVTDTINATTLNLSAANTVAEGGTITYTATVDHAPQGDLVIALSNGQSITILSGQLSGSVNVAAPTDDAVIDAGNVSVTVTNTTGGNFEQLNIGTGATGNPVVTAVTDTIDTTTLSLTATPNVAEGGNITYTASVTHPAGTDMAVMLSNGSTITILAGHSSGTVTIAAPTDDVYIDAGNVSATITGHTGGNFENVVNGIISASTAVADTINATTVNLSATNTVAEGGNIVYTATVDHAPQGDVVVALSNGQSITILSGQLSGTVTMAAPADDAVIDASTVSVTVSSATGGNFEQLNIGTGATGNPVVTTVTDTVDATTLNLTATPSVAEGGNIVYTATVNHPTDTALTIALSNGQQIVIAAGATSGSVISAAPTDDVYIDAGTVTTSIVGTPTGGNFENLVIVGGSASTAVSDTINTTTVSLTGPGSLTEGNSGVYQVTLGAPAQTAVTVQITYGGTANGSDFTGVTSVTIPAGQSSATFNVAALHDGAVEGTETLTVNLGAVSGGNFEQLSVNPAAASVTTNIVDTDTTTVSLSATSSITEAGGPVVYTATLTQAPVSDLTVTLSNGAVITVVAGHTSGSTTVPIAASDDVYIDPSNLSATITGTTGGGVSVAIDPTAAVTAVTDTINTTTLNLTGTSSVAEGGSIVYTANLDHAAGTALSVTLSNGAVINIAAGQSTGSVTVAAPGDDALIDAGNVNVTVAGTNGGNFEQLTVDAGSNAKPVVTAVTDTINNTTLNLTATSSVAEGGNITYTASVTNPTGTAMTVTLSNGSVINIAAGQSSGSVSVPAHGDDVYVDAGNVTVSVTGHSGGNFENLVNGTVSATTAVTDTIDNTTLNLTATPSVAEGGSIVYTASLNHATDTAMAVTLSNGAIINIAAGQSTGTVTVAAPSDDAIIDAGSVSVTVANTAGGNFEQLTVGTGASTNPVVTAVTDTINATTLSLTATTSVAEGGNIVYTASVSNPTGTAMTVTLSNGSVINIAAGQSSGSVPVPAHGDDVYIDAGNVTASITGTTGGNFESLVNGTVSATTAVTDTINTTTLNLTGTSTVAEGGSIVYTATLDHAAGTALAVTLSNGAIINIAAGQSTGTVTVAAPSDDAIIDAGNVSVKVAGTSGGNFEQLVVGTGSNANPVVTAVTDTINTTTLTLTATSTVAEGGNIVYTASVNNPTGTAMTVTLSNGSVINIAAGQSSGSVTVPAHADDVYVDAGNVTASVTGTTGGNFEQLVNGTVSATTAVTDTINATTLNLSATTSVAEGGNIVYTANLNHAAGTPLDVTLSNGAVIHIAAGQSTGTVTVAAPSDDAIIDAGNVSVTVTNTSGGNFEQLNVGNGTNANPVVTAVTDTINTTTLSLTATSSVAEGGNIVYTASVNNPTGTAMTVTLSNGSVINIAAGQSSGSVTVPAHGDDVYIDAGNVTASITGSTGGNFEQLVNGTISATTAVTDTINTTTLNLTGTSAVAEGGSIVYTANLDHAAGTSMVVTLSNGATINIAAGQSTGTVTVAAPTDDAVIDASNVNVTVTNTTGGNFEQLAIGTGATANPVVTHVTDTINNTTLSLTATGSVAEGGNIVYTASVTNPTGTDLTVALSNGTSIVIHAGQSSGSVAVPAPTDDVYVDAGNVTTSITGTVGGNFENLVNGTVSATTAVTDTINNTTLNLTGSSSVVEGAAGSYTLTLGHPAQTAVTVNLTYSGTATNGSDYTGVATVTIAAGQSTANFNIATIDDTHFEGSESLTVSIASATGGNFESLTLGSATSVTTTIVDNDTAPTVTAIGSPTVTEGDNLVYNVTLSNDSTTPTTFAYNLGGGSSTASTGDYGTPTFSNGVTLSNGVLTVPAGVSSFSVTLPTVNDTVNEANETVQLSVGNQTGTGTINDNDTAPSLVINDVNVNEDAGTATFTVTLSAVSGQSVSVAYNTSNGTATAGSDYTAASGTLTFAPGETTKTITVNITNDTVYEGTVGETFNVNLTSATNATIADNLGIGAIKDNDAVPTILSITSPTAVEGNSLVYTVSVNGTSSTPTTFNYTLGGGTAAAGDDYTTTPTFTNGVTLSNGVLTVPIGVTTFTVTIPTVNDVLNEASETVPLTIGGQTGTGTITDNDPTPSLVINDMTVNEGAGTATFTVTLSAASGQQVTVGYNTSNGTATAGSDYTAANGTLTFAPGETTKTITVPIINDTVYEGTTGETFNVNLTGATNATIADNLGVGTITDNDAVPTVSTITNDSETEGTALVHTVTLSNASTTATALTFSLGGGTAAANDYGTPTFSNGVTLSNGVLSVPAGVTSFTVTIPTTNDGAVEANETVNLVIGGKTGVGTIVDNDFAPVLDLDASGAGTGYTTSYTENGGGVSIADIDISITDQDGTTLAGATITLVNPQTGDVGNVGTLPGGITSTVSGNSIILSGVASTTDYQAAIRSLTFSNATDNPDTTPRTITVVVNDGANNSNVATATVNVIAVNDAPVNTVPSTITVTEDVASPITGISVGDVDAGSSNLQVTLSAPAGTFAGTAPTPASGISISGGGTGSIVLTGSQSAINAYIAAGNVKYTSATNASGDIALTVKTSDLGNTGTGGALTDTDTVTLHINPVADAPTVTASNASGVEGTWINLSLSAALTDTDGSESISSRTLSAVPVGASITDGTNTFTATAGNTSLNLAGWNLSSLQFKGVDNDMNSTDKTYTLTLSATSTESAGGSATTSQNFNVVVIDTAPTANADVDSVGVGATINGNVISGAGGNTTTGADTIRLDGGTLTGISYNGTPATFNSSTGKWTVVAANGTFTIEPDGDYTYTSKYNNIAVTSSAQSSWTTANSGVVYSGFDLTSPLNPNGTLNTTSVALNANQNINFSTASGNEGLGVEQLGGDAKLGTNEELVLNLGMNSKAASVGISNLLTGETGTWFAYSSTGVQVGTGTIAANSTSVNISTGSAFQYLMFTASSGSYRISTLSAQQDLSGLNPDVITYTVTDADGDTSSTTLSVSTSSQAQAVADVATVYESGLSSGTDPGGHGHPIIATGNLLDNDAGVGSLNAISSVNGTAPVNGVVTLTDSYGTLKVWTAADSTHHAGDYQYTLTAPTAEGSTDDRTYTYQLTGAGGQTTSSTLTVHVADDAPIGGNVTQTLHAADTLPTYNLVLTIDVSGSMATMVGNTGETRLQIAKEALAELIHKFDEIGNVNVQIVAFSDTVTESSWFSDNPQAALSYINLLEPTNGTQYSTALNAVMNGFTQPTADKTLFYFISDGEPTSGYAVNATQQTQWQNFVSANGSISFGIGIGDASLSALNPIAFPNGTNEPYAIKVNDPADLADTLLSTIDQGVVLGNVSVLSTSGDSGFAIGADGGHLQSIVVDGTTYTYSASTPQITVHTAKGGELSFDMNTGEYSYRLTVNTTIQGEQEVFPITVVDNDGDTKTINLTINLDYVANLDASRDIILTNVTDGSPLTISTDALLHNDTVTDGTTFGGTSGAVGGTLAVSGGNVIFDPTAALATSTSGFGTTFTAINESTFNNNAFAGDASNAAKNNTYQTAMDLTNRALFGPVTNATAALDLADPELPSVKISGTLTAANGARDNDYIKVHLKAGETLYMDIDRGVDGTASTSVDSYLYLYDTNGTTVLASNDTSASIDSGSTSTQDPYLAYTVNVEGDYYVRVAQSTNASASDAGGDYDLWLSIDPQLVPSTSPTGFIYTLNDSGEHDSAAAAVYGVSGSTIVGSESDEILYGSGNADTLYGGGGKDVLLGNDGNDTLRGGAGDDRLEGGSGNDNLDGGTGNDLLIGGTGNDTLTGGMGADTFAWRLGDKGAQGTPAVDTITDFDNTSTGDKLDLRDLLSGEHKTGVDANLENYLHFEKSGSNTIVHISSNGGFSADTHNVGTGQTASHEDQTIVLQNVNLIGSFTTDQQVIQDLISRGKLNTD